MNDSIATIEPDEGLLPALDKATTAYPLFASGYVLGNAASALSSIILAVLSATRYGCKVISILYQKTSQEERF